MVYNYALLWTRGIWGDGTIDPTTTMMAHTEFPILCNILLLLHNRILAAESVVGAAMWYK